MAAKTSPKWRQATLTTCRTCGAYVVQGFDSDNAALNVTVGLTPISVEAERTVRQMGYRTLELVNGELWRRFIPGGRVHGTLHAQHPCEVRAERERASWSPSRLSDLLEVER